MSLILDALNRSRQESEGMPGLSSSHPVGRPADSVNWVQWLLVAALALAVFAIGWLLVDRSPRPGLPPPAGAAVMDAPAAVAQLEPVEQIQQIQQVEQVEQVAQLEQARQPGQVEPVEPLAQTFTEPGSDPLPAPPTVTVASPVQHPLAVAEHPVGAAPLDESVAALYQQESQESREDQVEPARAAYASDAAAAEVGPARGAAESRQEETIDIEQLVSSAKAELADSRLADNGVPFLSSLSQQKKDAIPTLMYQRHDYSGDSARSSVVINGKTLRAGGTIGAVKIEEILPDSVVLESGGTRFRLRALNSWVNL